MKTLMKTTLVALCGLALTAYTVQASDPHYTQRRAVEKPFSWTGLYVGGGVGYQVGDSELTLTNTASINGLSSRGWGWDGRIGADIQLLANSPLVVGVFGQYGGGDTEFDISVTGPGTIVGASIEQKWAVGGRIGWAINKTLLYTGAAYTRGDLNINVPIAPGICAPAVLQCGHDLDGYMFILGVETYILPQVTAGLEYSFTDYDKANLFPASVAPTQLNVDSDVHAIKVRFNWRPTTGLFNN